MVVLRASVGNFAVSILTLLTQLGCGGDVESGATQPGTAQGGDAGAGAGGGAGRGGTNSGGALSTFLCTPTTDSSGFVSCKEGWTHREHAAECSSALPRATACAAIDGTSTCTQDSDCVASANGYCSTYEMGVGCYCNYGCTRDTDCVAGQICQCGDPVGHCITASCTTDADCSSGVCADYDTSPGCGGKAFACTTERDVCRSGSDCPGGYCVLDASGYRVCAAASCVVGRPFLVAGEDRRAEPVNRADWTCATKHEAFQSVGPEQRTRLGRYYAEMALMEHASVTAFARLVMELSAQGAPAKLIAEVIDAQRDEVEHAQVAFALSSELQGLAIGPGRLSLAGAQLGVSVEALAYTTVVEGCVGETLAALEAREASERTMHPSLKRVLRRIADDESRHAALSWKVVAWLLEVGGTAVAEAVSLAFDDAAAQREPSRQTLPEDESFGALSENTARELRRQVFDQIIEPSRKRLQPRSSGRQQSSRVNA